MEQLSAIAPAVGRHFRGIAPSAAGDWGSFQGDETSRLEQYAFQFGRCYDAYLAAEPVWEPFWSKGCRGAVAMVRQGRHLFSSGGLLAPEAHRAELLAQLVEAADARQEVLTFFNIPEEQLPLFRRRGFQATKLGEEALVDLPECTWAGKSYEWVRRQSNFCRRHGLMVSECRPHAMTAAGWQALAGELLEVSGLFLNDKPQSGEVRFLQAGFDPARLGRKRVFAARADGGAGRIEGFLACSPCQGGDTWVFETYRQRPDAVRGTIPFLLHQVMQTLQAEGVRRVSLCLIPGLRCREPLAGDSRMARWGLVLGTQHFNLVFDTAGAYHFKSRFRPRFENRYLCVRPRMSLATAVAFVRLLGVLRLDVGKLCQQVLRRWRTRSSRATLRTPEFEGLGIRD
jgi:phosphatidylglycerol lysyltransferase